MLREWETYCILADKKGRGWKAFSLQKQADVWATLDKSLPILIQNRQTVLQLKEPEIWFIRILIHKVRGKCIDIRQFEKIQDEYNIRYVPTDNGIVFSLEEWEQILPILFKLWRKHKDAK